MTAVRVAAVILILAVVIIAPRWPGIRDQWRHFRRDRVQELLDQVFPDPDTSRWPDRCSMPPCDAEDHWTCARHKCPDCTAISPCIRHDDAFWEVMRGWEEVS